MSDININGIPNMGFQGGGGGYFYDPYANLMQNQAAIQHNNQAVSNASAAVGSNSNVYDPFKQSGGFGTLTDYYSSLGASYGRATGGFGGTPGRVGTIGNPGTSNPGYLDSGAYNPFVSGAPPIQHYGGIGGNQVFDTGRYLEQNPDVWKSGATPWEHYNQFGRQEGRQAPWSNIFDTQSYLQANPDVAASGMDPTAHWLQFGQKEGREGQTFNPSQYLSQNRDVWEAGADPWQHYNQFGKNEGRGGAWSSFNTGGYLAANPDVAASGMDPTAHWYQFGQKEGRQGQEFDANKYLAQNPDVFAAGADPWQHYQRYGEKEGRQGAWSDAFNANTYSQHNPDVAAAGVDPTAHWYQFGQKEGRQAGGDAFNPQEYLLNNRDVAAAGMDPLQHWMNYGYKEGRQQAFGGTEADDWTGYFNQATAGGGGGNTGRDALAAEYYLANQDVYDAARASGQDPTQFAVEHFLNYGQNEGRRIFDANEHSDPNFDTAGYFSAHPDQYRAFLSADNPYTNPTAFAEMSNYQSPSNDYNTFQKGPSYNWQSSMPQGRNDPRVINAIYKAAGETGLNPAAIAAIMNMESVWNPTNRTGEQFGLAQMSGDMWGDNPFKGTMGGVDFNTYKNDTVGDKQISAYTDWLIRGGKLNMNGIDVAAQSDPVMQAALLQAIQFAGNSSGWREALAQGNMDTYVTTQHPQAKELRPGGEAYPTINSMYNAYDRILGGWMR